MLGRFKTMVINHNPNMLLDLLSVHIDSSFLEVKSFDDIRKKHFACNNSILKARELIRSLDYEYI